MPYGLVAIEFDPERKAVSRCVLGADIGLEHIFGLASAGGARLWVLGRSSGGGKGETEALLVDIDRVAIPLPGFPSALM